jgi:hypothetical protein
MLSTALPLTPTALSAKMTHHDSLEPIPGTEAVQADFNAEKALIPRPSSDPRDPLNWSMRWKSKSQQIPTLPLPIPIVSLLLHPNNPTIALPSIDITPH